MVANKQLTAPQNNFSGGMHAIHFGKNIEIPTQSEMMTETLHPTPPQTEVIEYLKS